MKRKLKKISCVLCEDKRDYQIGYFLQSYDFQKNYTFFYCEQFLMKIVEFDKFKTNCRRFFKEISINFWTNFAHRFLYLINFYERKAAKHCPDCDKPTLGQ